MTIALRSGIAAVSLLFGLTAPAFAQFPSKAIEIVVPFAPGGSSDLGARVIAKALQEKWKVPVRVINQPGGNTVPALDDVRKSAPDGHKVMWDTNASTSVLGSAVKNLPFDVMDRTFISMMTDTPVMMGVNADSPHKTLKDIEAAAKRDPASVSWTSVGGASAIDTLFRRYFKAIGVDIAKTRMVVTKGGGSEAALQVAGGHVMLAAGSYSSFSSLLQAKKLRVVATFSQNRLSLLPDVPTTAQAGYPDLHVVQFAGISGPPGVPKEIVDRWHNTLKELMATDEVKQSLVRLGLEPNSRDGEHMRKFVTSEITVVKEIYGR